MLADFRAVQAAGFSFVFDPADCLLMGDPARPGIVSERLERL